LFLKQAVQREKGSCNGLEPKTRFNGLKTQKVIKLPEASLFSDPWQSLCSSIKEQKIEAFGWFLHAGLPLVAANSNAFVPPRFVYGGTIFCEGRSWPGMKHVTVPKVPNFAPFLQNKKSSFIASDF